jgi:peptide deformylase
MATETNLPGMNAVERLLGIYAPQDTIVTDNTFLRQKSKKTTWKQVEDLKLEEHIKAALPTAWTPGFGLAAIQIGVPLRFAYYTFPDPKDKEKRIEKKLLNPQILKASYPCIIKEGCLSLPDKWYMVSRFMEIIYKPDYTDEQVYIVRGVEAQVIQHEIDHMDGLTIINRQVRSSEKIGRNEPCPECGKKGVVIKYKKCKEHFQS